MMTPAPEPVYPIEVQVGPNVSFDPVQNKYTVMKEIVRPMNCTYTKSWEGPVTITDDTCDPNEHLHPDKPTISIDEQNVLLRSELAKAEAELNFWHMLHEHTQLITRAEVLSRAVNQLVADASILEPEIERLKKIYLPD